MVKAACLVLVAGLVACGDPAVKKDDVEKIASEQLVANNPGKQFPVTCPSGLKAKVGTTLTCSTMMDSKPHDVNIKVTSVEGTSVKFDINVADAAH